MPRWLSALAAVATFFVTPALAAPCKTEGKADAPMAFPTNDASDVAFARSMVRVILPNVTDALPRTLRCTRLTVRTPIGDYAIGGENRDAFPRLAFRADGKAGPIVYLATPARAPGAFALVVYRRGSLAIIKQFYAALPTDQRLAEDVRAALTDDAGIIAYDAERKRVGYGFAPPDGIPPPVESGARADGTAVTAGPQFMILDSGDPRLLNADDHMRHTPSGFTCPQTFDGVPILLMLIDPRTDYLSCSYRAGTDLRFREDDKIRYQVSLIRAKAGTTP